MAVEAPKWFEENFYLNAKAGQLNAVKYDGKADWTGAAVKTSLGEMSAYDHYLAYGKGENISPNSMFNVAEYLKAKADQLNASKFEGKTTWSEADVMKSFNDSGLSAWDHFAQYGMSEGLNPSNMFDVDSYLAAKAAQLNDLKIEGKSDWTADDVAASLKGAGLNPVQHYYLYGQGEGLTISKVPAQDQVISGYNPYTPVDPGTTFPLTTAADTFEGTAKDDTINGVSSALSSERTLNAEDVIDGKDGNDTLNVAMNGNFNGFTTGSMANVENVVLTTDSSIPLSFDAEGIKGVDTWTLNSKDAPISLDGLGAAGITVNVLGLKEGNTDIGFTTEAVAGDKDALNLGLNNVGTADSEAGKDDGKDVTITAGGIEDLTITVTDDNYVDLADAANNSITVKGAGNLNVSVVDSDLTSFDASALSGKLTANLTNATLKTVKGGSGDDHITVQNLAANVVLDGGAGNDTLVFQGVNGTLQPTMKGFENITADGGTLTISGKNVSDFNSLTVMNGANVTLANMNTPTFTVTSEGTTAGSVTLTDATALTYNTVADDTSIKDKTADAISTGITAGKATSATVNVGAYTAVTGTLDFGAAKNLSINVASGLGGADGKDEMTSFGGATTTVNANNAQSLTLKAEGNLGAATYNVAKAESVVVDAAKGSTGALDFNAGKATTVSITAGASMNITDSDFASAQNVTLVQNKGALTGAVALAAVNKLTVSGEGKDSAITLGALGSATQEYGITVNASGLKDGLAMGAINANIGDVTLNLADVTGKATAGAIAGKNVNIQASQLGSTETGNISSSGNVVIDAMGVLGGGIAADAFKTGTIGATKAVTINFDGSNDMEFGAITGKSVNIDASGYLGAINLASVDGNKGDAIIGAIVGETVTIKGSEIGANTFTAITADTLNFTGGLGIDTVTVTDNAAGTNTKMDVTLNTGAADDVVTVKTIDTTTEIIVKGDMGGNTVDEITVDTSASDTTGITIDLSGLKGYATSALSGSDGKFSDTFVLGAGSDTVKLGLSATAGIETIKGFEVGTGNDVLSLLKSDFATIVSTVEADHDWSDGITATATNIVTISGSDAKNVKIAAAATADTIGVGNTGSVLIIFEDTDTGLASFYLVDATGTLPADLSAATSLLDVTLQGVNVEDLVDGNFAFA